ncbi:MAG: hypothetical protein FWC40_07260, partial [Proteobacteria bacterium]|nr:hypothetical protein [Pseudomonadota bacterium]
TDYKYDLPTLDTTIVHELAHIVDTGQKYSARSDFRKISDWKDEGKDSAKLVKKIESYAATPYAAALSNEEKTVATKGAQRLIDNDVVKIDDISDEVSKAYDELNKDKDGSDPQKRNIFQAAWDAVTSKPKDGCRSAEDLTTVLKGSTVYQHIIRSRAISKPLPCYGGLRPDMNRQMHQGYENGVWYSYANKAYEQKISMYQFRDPGEEFAELYATYHCAAPKGSKTSDVHKQWFHKVNLHRDEPGKK